MSEQSIITSAPVGRRLSGAPRVLREAQANRLVTRVPVLVIAGFTTTAAVVAALLVRLSDPGEFRTFPDALWWATQTITTVGYGDIVPQQTAGRVIGSIVMLMGIALIAVITATVTATLVDASRAGSPDAPSEGNDQLAQILDRLAAIEEAVDRGREDAGRPPRHLLP